MNIGSVSETKQINMNSGPNSGAQTASAALSPQGNVVTQSGTLSAEGAAGLNLLMALNEGDTFSGEITNITREQVTINLGNNASVQASLADALSFNIGDTASFSVKSNNSGQIILKVLNTENLRDPANDQTVQSALRSANMAINNETVSLVHNLMKQGEPIDAQSLTEYSRMWAGAPNATAEDVIFLNKMNIPVTPENVSALHQFYDFNDGMSQHIGEIGNAMDDFLYENLGEKGPADTANVLRSLVDVFSTASNTVGADSANTQSASSLNENISLMMSRESLDNLSSQIKNLSPDFMLDFDPESHPETLEAQTKTEEALRSLSDKISSGNSSAKKILTDLAKIMDENIIDKDKLMDLFKSKDFKGLTDNLLRQELFVKPEEFSKDSVKELMARIIHDADNLAEKLAGNEKAAGLLDSVEQMKQTVEFTNDMNQVMAFIQIPIKMSSQNAHGDLYVYKNKKGQAAQDGTLTAFLHLDMDNLGPMDILAKLNNNVVTTNFKVATDDILDFIESHMDELNARLKALGYQVNSEVSLSEGKYDFKKTVLETEFPPVEIKRFSFDIRA